MKSKTYFPFGKCLRRAALAGMILCLGLGLGGLSAARAQNAITPSVQSLSLVPGWNLVSFYLHPLSPAIQDVLAGIDGKYDMVYAWDVTGSQSGRWLIFVPGVPGNDLLTLDETRGFWIRMKVEAILNIVGTPPATTSIELSAAAGGWNLVGYPTNQNQILPDVLTLNGVKDFSLVYAYNAADPAASPLPPWKHYAPGIPGNNLLEMVPGWGYWIKVGSPATWTVPGPVPGESGLKLSVAQSPLAIYPPVMIYTAQLVVLIPFPVSGFTVDFYNLSGKGLEYLGSVETKTGQAVLSRPIYPGTYTAIARAVINSQVFWSNAVTYTVL